MINREYIENELKEKMNIKHSGGYVVTIEDNLVHGITNDLFYKEFSTGLSGVKPQLDFYLENNKTIIGFESKFLEYYQQTTASFSDSYKTLTYFSNTWFELIDKYQGKRCEGVNRAAKGLVNLAFLCRESEDSWHVQIYPKGRS